MYTYSITRISQVNASKLMKGLIALYLSIDLASDYAVDIVTAGLPNVFFNLTVFTRNLATV